jgi:hypothetical protein
MKKNLKKLLATMISLALVVSTSFLTVTLDTVTDYSFENAELLPSISTETSAFAVAADGTLLKRVNVFGEFEEYIVKSVGANSFSFPIEAARFTSSKLYNLVKSLILGISLRLKLNVFWQLTATFIIALIVLCTWQDKINAKQKNILSVIYRSMGYCTKVCLMRGFLFLFQPTRT